MTSFTLAEVLIVLGIIGLIADMTIPTLVQSTQTKVNIVSLKKFHSTFENAFRLAVLENGSPDEWVVGISGNGQIAAKSFENIKPYLKMLKYCGVEEGCLPDVDYKQLDNMVSGNFNKHTGLVKGQLADGSSFLYDIDNILCQKSVGSSPSLANVCGRITADVNGFKGPNRYGYDFFVFWITKNGIIPWGTAGDEDEESSFISSCSSASTMSGVGCAAWVIYNENMDYTKCNGLSWQDKKSCS